MTSRLFVLALESRAYVLELWTCDCVRSAVQDRHTRAEYFIRCSLLYQLQFFKTLTSRSLILGMNTWSFEAEESFSWSGNSWKIEI